MKHYIIRYHDYIAEFLQELPKERFLRLCRLMATMNANEAAELKEKCKEHIKNYYGFDPDFNGIL